MKVSKYIINFFKSKGISTFFVYQGGAIMNLINDIGNDKSLKYIVPHHEQSLSMQVDTFSRLNGYSVGMVTSGPGATNILTGVCSAYYDSIPCFFITGQVGQVHIKKNKKHRQFGFQETDVVSIFKSVTKYVKQIRKPEEIKYELEKAYYISKNGRPGPVLLDIPFNIQIAQLKNKLKSFKPIRNKISTKEVKKIEKVNLLLEKSLKPILLIGGGIKNSNSRNRLLKIIKKNNIPYVTTWCSQDISSHDDNNYIGSIGKNGHRSANLACEEADLILTIGQRFAVKNIFGNFGRNAKIISIDIDKQELKTPLIKINLSINLAIDDFLKKFNPSINKNSIKSWIKRLEIIKKDFFEIFIFNKNKTNNNVNPFVFFSKISKLINSNFVIHVDIGAHQTWFFQSFLNKKGQQIINHCGHGAMGHAICSSIASFYSKKKNNLVFIGDGGFMMNVQELNYIRKNSIPIKIVILNNYSLGNTFLGTLIKFNKTFGNDEKNGYATPNIKNISRGFEIEYFNLKKDNKIEEIFKNFLKSNTHSILEVEISKFQPTAELDNIKSKNKIVYI